MSTDVREESPAISVIVPCYNAEKTIGRVLESLENQSFSDFEVVVINDGSSDKTKEIATSYLENSNLNMVYIEQENQGVSYARNAGLNLAKGKYITFVDADDIYNREFLNILYHEIEKDRSDTVFCAYSRDLDRVQRFAPTDVTTESLDHMSLLDFVMIRKASCAFFTFIYKIDILRRHKIYFDANLKYGEDLEFLWKYLSHCKSGVFVPLELHGYYDNPLSAMNNISWRAADLLTSTKQTEAYLMANQDPFYQKFKNYMFHRAIWSLLKDFSLHGKKDEFNKVVLENRIEESLRIVGKNTSDYRVKLSILLYRIDKRFFFFFFRALYIILRKA